jgi:cytochrome c peroxidase
MPQALLCFLVSFWLLTGAATVALASGDDNHPPSADYRWDLPPGFPPPAVPADNPMSMQKVELGRRLFREKRLSVSGTYACISCHRPELAFTDGRAKAQGATNDQTRRSAMSLTNVAYNAAFSWADPSVNSLEAQMLQPLLNQHPIEMGLKGHENELVTWLSTDAGYRQLFADAFPDDSTALRFANVVNAVAAYERTLISGRSPFDRYVYEDDPSALSPGAKRGMALFYSPRVGCGRCHFGPNFSGPLRYQGHEWVVPIFANTGLYSINGRGAYPVSDQGLFEITHQAADMGKMRVPTLRNVALTAPYMHDGSIATLAEVIDHYALGGRQLPDGPSVRNRLVDRRMHGFKLTSAEKEDLIAFLESLTDAQFTAAR